MSKITFSGNGNLIVEDAEIIYRNFRGEGKEFNDEGDRNFCLVLTPEQADTLRDKGMNVKEMKARPEDEEPPNWYLPVAVEYRKGRPPRCVMINSQGRIDLGQEEVGMFDWIEIAKADLIINPYPWNKGGKSGVKAYVKSLFITVSEDELEQMYAHIPDAGSRPEAEPIEHDTYSE